MTVDILIKMMILNNDKITDQLAKTSEGYANVSLNKASTASYPMIEISKFDDRDIQLADDREYLSSKNYEICYYSKYKDFYKIEDELKDLFLDNGFVCTYGYSQTNNYTNIHHNYLHFRFDGTREMRDILIEQQDVIFSKKYPSGLPEEVLPDGDYVDEETGKDYKMVNNEPVYEITDGEFLP